jgi:hypothetical protein
VKLLIPWEKNVPPPATGLAPGRVCARAADNLSCNRKEQGLSGGEDLLGAKRAPMNTLEGRSKNFWITEALNSPPIRPGMRKGRSVEMPLGVLCSHASFREFRGSNACDGNTPRAGAECSQLFVQSTKLYGSLFSSIYAYSAADVCSTREARLLW